MLIATNRHKNHFDLFDLSILVPKSITVAPIVSEDGLTCRFNAADIEKVNELELDLIIRCGRDILDAEILRAAKHGTISLHYGDDRIRRGGPSGFWEVYLREDTTGFTLRRLTSELDREDVLMRGHLPTQWYFLLNQAALLEKSNYYLKVIVDKIARTGQVPASLENFPYVNKLFHAPNLREAVAYLSKLIWRINLRFLRRSLGVKYWWGVAYTRSNWPNAQLWRGVKLKAPPLHFLADPFVIERDGEEFCFVEDYDYLERRGSIAVYNITGERAIRVGTALNEGFHLSFPFLFSYKDQLFMCPETHQKREIRIYRCIEFPLQWSLEKILIKDVSAADSMLFEKDGKWWIFTNIDPIGSGDHCSELDIFYADSPLAEKWTPHALNPILVDASRARNGGLVQSGNYFRVSQAQGFDFYGKAAHINKIVELTGAKYDEVSVAEIKPTFYRALVGTHHFHSNGNITAFDFVAVLWMPMTLINSARRAGSEVLRLIGQTAFRRHR